MNRQALYFTGPRAVEVQEELLPDLASGQVLVQTAMSGISAGTEMLLYRGEFPPGMAVDEAIVALGGNFDYPFRYGYSCVGRVIDCGLGVDVGWLDQMVFSFQPHASYFVASIDNLIGLPANVEAQEAIFVPNMETAINFVHDGRPLLGEKVVVFGQGIVGLLTTALLTQFPLECILTVESYLKRREASTDAGASEVFSLDDIDSLNATLADAHYPGADLIYELSGAPAALDIAVAIAGYHARIVIGSWYGQKRVELDLGGVFHRSRIQLISSQVSTISPKLRGRWNVKRRFESVWDQIEKVRPSQFITHRIPFVQATQAYQLIDQSPGDTLQVVLTYD